MIVAGIHSTVECSTTALASIPVDAFVLLCLLYVVSCSSTPFESAFQQLAMKRLGTDLVFSLLGTYWSFLDLPTVFHPVRRFWP